MQSKLNHKVIYARSACDVVTTTVFILYTLLELIKNNPESAKLLAAIQMPQPIEADYLRDYASLTQLKLDKYAENEVAY